MYQKFSLLTLPLYHHCIWQHYKSIEKSSWLPQSAELFRWVSYNLVWAPQKPQVWDRRERCLTLFIHKQTDTSTSLLYFCFLPPTSQKQEELVPASIRRSLCARSLRLKKLTVNYFLKSSQRLQYGTEKNYYSYTPTADVLQPSPSSPCCLPFPTSP